jgi:hypothetical protein
MTVDTGLGDDVVNGVILSFLWSATYNVARTGGIMVWSVCVKEVDLL